MPAEHPDVDLALNAIDAKAQIDDIEQSKGRPGRLPMAVLYAFVVGDVNDVPADFDERLASDEKAQRDLAYLLSKVSRAEISPAAAASTPLNRRECDTAIIVLSVSDGSGDITFVTTEMTDPHGEAPTALVIKNHKGEWLRVDLISYQAASGQATLRSDAMEVEALRDPASQVFVR